MRRNISAIFFDIAFNAVRATKSKIGREKDVR